MWCLETLERINAPGFERPKPDPLWNHPRIVALRRFVSALPVPYEYTLRLKRSIHRYADQIIARPVYGAWHGLSDVEAIQQVTLEDWNEENLQKSFEMLA